MTRSALVLCISAALAAVLGLAGCGGSDDAAAPEPEPAPAPAASMPEVVEVVPTHVDGDVWSLEITLHSPTHSPDRYPDGWRVLAPDGTVLGEQALPYHDTGGQPVTHTQPHVRVPEGTDEILVEPSDSVHGYGGETLTVPLEQPPGS